MKGSWPLHRNHLTKPSICTVLWTLLTRSCISITSHVPCQRETGFCVTIWLCVSPLQWQAISLTVIEKVQIAAIILGSLFLIASISWLIWSSLSPSAKWQRQDLLFQICYGMYGFMDIVCIGKRTSVEDWPQSTETSSHSAAAVADELHKNITWKDRYTVEGLGDRARRDALCNKKSSKGNRVCSAKTEILINAGHIMQAQTLLVLRNRSHSAGC